MGKYIKEKQNLSYLEWSKIRNSSGTAGSFLKSYEIISGKKIYYKLSNYNSIDGVIGHESINELIIDRLLSILNFEHLNYDLINAKIKIDGKEINTYVCASEDFRKKDEEKIALDSFYVISKNENESPLEFCIRQGFEKQIYEIFVIDFLILNRDRHGANVEVLRNSKNGKIRLAPSFDHGLSLLAPCSTKESILNFDVLQDRQIQSFFGKNSAYANLHLIPKNKLPKIKHFSVSYRKVLFKDIEDIMDKDLQNKIWEMISKRWKYYESFCD